MDDKSHDIDLSEIKSNALSEIQKGDCKRSLICPQSSCQSSTQQQEKATTLTNGHHVSNRFHRLRYQFHKQEDLDDSSLTPRLMGKDFCSRTSSQGISHVYYAPSGVKKIIWLVFTVAAFILLITHITILMMRYMRYDKTTEVSVVSYKTMEFPAVTICNNRKYRGASEYSYRDTVIVSAKFDSHEINRNEFESFTNRLYGECVTFNKYEPRWETRRSIPDLGYGLYLLLNIMAYDYHPPENSYIASQHGAVIHLHHPDVDPVPEEGKILVSPGTSNFIAVTKTNITRLGAKYGDCMAINKTNLNYTRQSCENKCLQAAVVKECCCYIEEIGNYPHKDKVWNEYDRESSCWGRKIAECNDTNIECWDTAWKNYDAGDNSCEGCVDRCSEIRFGQSLQSMQWPRDEDYQINEKSSLKLDGYFSRAELPESNETKLSFNFIKRNFVEVHIYFESVTTFTIKEVADYETFEFISELGGTFGLWAGWTVMTVMEFFEFLVDLVVLYNLKRKQNTRIINNTTECEKRKMRPQPAEGIRSCDNINNRSSEDKTGPRQINRMPSNKWLSYTLLPIGKATP